MVACLGLNSSTVVSEFCRLPFSKKIPTIVVFDLMYALTTFGGSGIHLSITMLSILILYDVHFCLF